MARQQRPRNDDPLDDNAEELAQGDITLDELAAEEDGDLDEDIDALDPITRDEEDHSWMDPAQSPLMRGGRNSRQASDEYPAGDSDDDDEEAELADEDITRRVRRLLRMDAATSSLRLRVETIEGVVYLRGEVETLDDGDLAAEVASRVPGVVDVVDETELEDR